MFKFNKTKKGNLVTYDYDKENEIPVLKCSICNGEQVTGFQNRMTGKIREIGCIRSPRELEEFMEGCGVSEVKKVF